MIRDRALRGHPDRCLRHRRTSRRCRGCWPGPAPMSTSSARTGGRSGGTSHLEGRPPAPRPRAQRPPRQRGPRRRRRRAFGRSSPASTRLMSSRFVTSRFSHSASRSIDAAISRRWSGGHSISGSMSVPAAARIDASGVRRSCDTESSRADLSASLRRDTSAVVASRLSRSRSSDAADLVRGRGEHPCLAGSGRRSRAAGSPRSTRATPAPRAIDTR